MNIKDMTDGEAYSIGDIGNHYGGLEVRVVNGVYQWSIENWNGHHWEEVSESLVVELLKHEEKIAGQMERTK